MSLYSGIVQVTVNDEPVCSAKVELTGDPKSDWGGWVRAADGASEAPKGLERSTEWVCFVCRRAQRQRLRRAAM